MEVMKMKEFYSFTKEDLPDLVSLLKKEEEMVKQEIPDGKEKRLLFLLRLVIDLLADADRSRKLKNTFVDERRQRGKLKGIESFIKIVEEWIEENNGKGNLLKVIEALRSNEQFNLASLLEQLLPRYSLPSSEDGNSPKVNSYSFSRDFLLVEENKDVSLCPLPLWNANRVEQALQNSVILEEVFKKLNSSDQQIFRLVTPTWMKETFSYWRRSSLLQLHVSGNLDDRKIIRGISMASFVKLLDLEESARKRKGKNARNVYELTEHPFHRYRLSYFKGFEYYKQEIPFSCGQIEAKFWQRCGPNIEDLEIDNAFFSRDAENAVGKICEKILLDTCPNLKKFKLGSSCRVEHPHLIDSQPGLVGKKESTDENINGKEASNLHTLAVEMYFKEEILRKILGLCPNLKTLILRTCWENSRALYPPTPTSNGECLKLEKLVIKYSGYYNYSADSFLPLRNYSEMLIKKGFNCLQHLTLEGLNLEDARTPPFDLYAALAKLSQSLKTLELDMTMHAWGDEIWERKWFPDLTPFAFPNLTVLKLSFHFYAQLTRAIHFDFGALKGTPKLERFELGMVNAKSLERNPGTQDWVFDGNRNEYFPVGVTVDYIYPEEEPILCSNLKEFTFTGGWSLNDEDFKLFSAWFPNLTHLKAGVELEAVSLQQLKKLTRLEKLDMETEKIISLGNLRRFWGKKKGLRICQTISIGRFQQSVEMKEHNERLYFDKRTSE